MIVFLITSEIIYVSLMWVYLLLALIFVSGLSFQLVYISIAEIIRSSLIYLCPWFSRLCCGMACWNHLFICTNRTNLLFLRPSSCGVVSNHCIYQICWWIWNTSVTSPLSILGISRVPLQSLVFLICLHLFLPSVFFIFFCFSFLWQDVSHKCHMLCYSWRRATVANVLDISFRWKKNIYFDLWWCHAWELFGAQIPITTEGFELWISCIRNSKLTH